MRNNYFRNGEYLFYPKNVTSHYNFNLIKCCYGGFEVRLKMMLGGIGRMVRWGGGGGVGDCIL